MTALNLLRQLSHARRAYGHEHPVTRALDFELDRIDYRAGHLRRLHRNGSGAARGGQRNPKWKAALEKFRARP